MYLNRSIVFYLITLLNVSGLSQCDSLVQNEILSSFSNNLISVFVKNGTDTLKMYTDTGGKNFIYKTGIRKLNVRRSRKNMWDKLGFEKALVHQSLPSSYYKEVFYSKDNVRGCDGMLGREWFANKVWTIDYDHSVFSSGMYCENTDSEASIFFKKDSLGIILNALPRVEVIIDGQTISLLLDTGAQASFSQNAQKQANLSEIGAISFIDRSTYNQWRVNHPDWTIIENADLSYRLNASIIQVPKIQIADKTIDSVWFAVRDDSNFETMSTYFMDKKIVGAIGGNALSKLGLITIDYRKETLSVYVIPGN